VTVAHKKTKWTGALAKPLVWTGPDSPELQLTIGHDREPTEKEKAAHRIKYAIAMQNVTEQEKAKIPALKAHYGLPDEPSSDAYLSLHLAREIVPGFQVKRPGEGRGRKKDTWTDGAYLCLLVDLENTKSKHLISHDLDACRLILKNPCEYNGNKKLRSSDTLERAAEVLSSRVRDARRWLATSGFKLPPGQRPHDFYIRLFATGTEMRAKMRGATFPR
jgi:hypothetical protein